MKKIGYVRVSTKGQRYDRQTQALRKQCDRLFFESASAKNLDRPIYDKAVGNLTSGDELVVLDIDRAYRNTRDALNEFHVLNMRGVSIRIVNFPIDTRTDEGYYEFIVSCARAELERRTISRRTKEGLAAARERGVVLGRPRKLSEDQISAARLRINSGTVTKRAMAKELDVGRWTLSRALDRLPPTAGV